MKAKIKYYFSRLIVLLVAVHSLDVSVDIDYITAYSFYNNEAYDDMDSISEYVLEKIFDDENLTTEGDDDDGNDNTKNIKNSPIALYYSYIRKSLDMTWVFKVQKNKLPASRNTKIQFEDYSRSLYTPPDFSLSS